MVLHTVNKSPFESQALASCLRVAQSNSRILLIEDAVIAAIQPLASDLKRLTVYVLKADLQARGLLDRVELPIQVIDYNGFVELAIQYSPIQSWS